MAEYSAKMRNPSTAHETGKYKDQRYPPVHERNVAPRGRVILPDEIHFAQHLAARALHVVGLDAAQLAKETQVLCVMNASVKMRRWQSHDGQKNSRG